MPRDCRTLMVPLIKALASAPSPLIFIFYSPLFIGLAHLLLMFSFNAIGFAWRVERQDDDHRFARFHHYISFWHLLAFFFSLPHMPACLYSLLYFTLASQASRILPPLGFRLGFPTILSPSFSFDNYFRWFSICNMVNISLSSPITFIRLLLVIYSRSRCRNSQITDAFVASSIDFSKHRLAEYIRLMITFWFFAIFHLLSKNASMQNDMIRDNTSCFIYGIGCTCAWILYTYYTISRNAFDRFIRTSLSIIFLIYLDFTFTFSQIDLKVVYHAAAAKFYRLRMNNADTWLL